MDAPRHLDLLGDEFVVVPPGGKVTLEQFVDFGTPTPAP
jgi:hypothetical protein